MEADRSENVNNVATSDKRQKESVLSMYSMTSRCLTVCTSLSSCRLLESPHLQQKCPGDSNDQATEFIRDSGDAFFLGETKSHPPRALSKVHPFRRLLSKTGSSPLSRLTLDIVVEGTEQCTGAARNDLTGMSEKQLDIKREREGWTSKAALWKTIVLTEPTRRTRDNVSVNINSGNSKRHSSPWRPARHKKESRTVTNRPSLCRRERIL